MLYTVTGPSGAGKSSLVGALRARDPGVRVSVSHTTRAPNAGEAHGQDYFFVDDAEFERMLAQRAFLEHAEVLGHRYGTSAAWVLERLGAGDDVILEIDWAGARAVHASALESASIFILPPSLDALRERLLARRRDSADEVDRRMRQALVDIRHYPESDYLVVNDSFERSVESLAHIVAAGHLRRAAQERRHAALCKALSEERETR